MTPSPVGPIRRRIGLFFKAPRPGRVKTRLTPPLSPVAAAELSRAFVEDSIALCRQVPEVDLILFHGGEAANDDPRAGIAGAEGIEWRPQVGADLGTRMAAALEGLIERPGDHALLLGSDAPDLPPAVVLQAFKLLENNDLTLGPALDGGYYLVGLSRPAPGLFEGISWSTASVLREQEAGAARLGLRTARLPPWQDVDLPEDLEQLRKRLEAAPTAAPSTRRALMRLDSLN